MNDICTPNKNIMKHFILIALASMVGLTEAVAQKFGHLDAQGAPFVA